MSLTKLVRFATYEDAERKAIVSYRTRPIFVHLKRTSLVFENYEEPQSDRMEGEFVNVLKVFKRFTYAV